MYESGVSYPNKVVLTILCLSGYHSYSRNKPHTRPPIFDLGLTKVLIFNYTVVIIVVTLRPLTVN